MYGNGIEHEPIVGRAAGRGVKVAEALSLEKGSLEWAGDSYVID